MSSPANDVASDDVANQGNPSPPGSSLTRRGPLGHRFLVFVFASGVTVLAFWFIGYVLRDIDQIRGPDYTAIVSSRLPPELTEQKTLLDEQMQENRRREKELTRRRDLLGATIDHSQQTINQLLELQRLSIEKQASLSEAQQTALAENLELFLGHQQQSQQFSEELVSLNLTADRLNAQSRALEKELALARAPLSKEYQAATQRHNWRLAAFKLALLLPILLIVAVSFWKTAGGTYSPLSRALGIALSLRVLMVMHDHFPAIYFKYLLIVTALIVVTWILVKLLHNVAHPAKAWLLKQYREAYAAFACPICEFPIRRGPLRFAAWNRRWLQKSLRPVSGSDAVAGDVPYTCPCCATALFETCDQCQGTRASLLPACDKCGHQK